MVHGQGGGRAERVLAGLDGVFGLAGRGIAAIRGAPLRILMYHGVIDAPLMLPDWCFVPSGEFAAQMDWLARRRVRVMDLVEAARALQEGRLDRPSVVITFDDGYRNNVEIALPILARHGLPATIFLTTGLIGSPHALWPSRLNLALSRTDRDALEFRGLRVGLNGHAERAAALAFLQEAVKAHAGDAPGDAVTEIEQALGVPTNPEAGRDSPFAMMDAADIETATRSGLITFGGHTVTHPLLSWLDDARLEQELDRSIDATEALTGQPCRSFAYPNGRAEDFDDRAVRHLARRGIEVAVTTVSGVNRSGADPLRLARWGVGPGMLQSRFAAAAQGLPLEEAARLLRRSRALRPAAQSGNQPRPS